MVRTEPSLDGYRGDEAHHARDDAPYVYRRGMRDDAPAYDDDFDDDRFEDEHYGLVDRVLAAPGKLAMAVVALIAFALVGVNAAYLQPGAHPSPMLSTRAQAPADPLPQNSYSVASQRSLTMAPAPIVPPSRSYDATASISAPDTTGQELARAPYVAPAPTPRPASFALAATPAAAPLPAIPLNAAPVGQVTTAAPVVLSAPAPRPVETATFVDPIGALLAPVIAGQSNAGIDPSLQQAAQTRSAQPVVAAVQAVLADMGYAPGSIDGVIGPSTEEAIRRFQLRRALEPNGQITGDLLREIERVTGTRLTAS